ncbi:RND family efflux transporter, MFP subunit [Ectothiorhodospira mobilis]|uniref:RND family efflux transporter, MFP subunit n=1 Tax=Ectothiorhodospira mobilis TaxID=195064 RepID=A0A1I4PNP0_ECTMO|nr:efflux RND transporter periplasmic adaptor subunit [Ectothiorhodospira mobilis]SFM29417.1 RND family efflux transporter, MFP subunit [Ectothiorhodospira mobilis]
MRRALLVIPTALVILTLFLWWMGRPDPGPGAGPGGGDQTVTVAAAAVEQTQITERLPFTGTLRSAHRVEIATRVTGELERLHVDIGDVVSPGDLLAELDDDEFQQEVEQAQAELGVSRATLQESEAALALARKELARTRELRAQRIASEAELETAATEVEAQKAQVMLARAQVQQRQAALRNARIRLGYTRIHADVEPGAGAWRVGERLVDPGSLLQANTRILTLVNLQPLIARIHVTERDYTRLAVGQPAEISVAAFPGVGFAGEVARIAPEFDEDSRQALVEIHVPNDNERLRPGMFAEVQVRTRTVERATVVPVEALVERDGRRGVFRVEETDTGPVARFVPVETGIETEGRVQILSPEMEGRVVTLGRHLLTDGTRLRLGELDEVLIEGVR